MSALAIHTLRFLPTLLSTALLSVAGVFVVRSVRSGSPSSALARAALGLAIALGAHSVGAIAAMHGVGALHGQLGMTDHETFVALRAIVGLPPAPLLIGASAAWILSAALLGRELVRARGSSSALRARRGPLVELAVALAALVTLPFWLGWAQQMEVRELQRVHEQLGIEA